MGNDPLPTRTPSSSEQLLKDKFAENIANQSERMDKLAQQLLTLELAVPGLYVTVLKLKSEKVTFSVDFPLWITFGCWFLALLLTLISLIPRNWKVNRNIIKQDPAVRTEELGIEDFFHKTAQYKRNLLIWASLSFFVGVLSAVFVYITS